MNEKEIVMENLKVMHKNMNNICARLDSLITDMENVDDEVSKEKFRTFLTSISIPAVMSEKAFSDAVECFAEDKHKYAGVSDIESDFGTAMYVSPECICLKLPRAHSRYSKLNVYSRLNTDFVRSLAARNKGSMPYFSQKMIVVINVYDSDSNWVDPDNIDIKSVIDSLVCEADLGGDSGRNTVYMSLCLRSKSIEAATYLLVVPEQEISKKQVSNMLDEIVNGTSSDKPSEMMPTESDEPNSAKQLSQALALKQKQKDAKQGKVEKISGFFIPKKSAFLKQVFGIKLLIRNDLKAALAKLFKRLF